LGGGKEGGGEKKKWGTLLFSLEKWKKRKTGNLTSKPHLRWEEKGSFTLFFIEWGKEKKN